MITTPTLRGLCLEFLPPPNRFRTALGVALGVEHVVVLARRSPHGGGGGRRVRRRFMECHGSSCTHHMHHTWHQVRVRVRGNANGHAHTHLRMHHIQVNELTHTLECIRSFTQTTYTYPHTHHPGTHTHPPTQAGDPTHTHTHTHPPPSSHASPTPASLALTLTPTHSIGGAPSAGVRCDGGGLGARRAQGRAGG